MSLKRRVKVGHRYIGDNEPTFIIAEIGINHNGSGEIAKEMIEAAQLNSRKELLNCVFPKVNGISRGILPGEE